MIASGQIYVVFTTLTRPPKDKITLCISAADNLFFWINTEVRQHGIGQLLLSVDDHPALTRDCYLDCSRVTMFLPQELAEARSRGPVSLQLARKIVEYLTQNPPKTLPGRHLKLALATMGALATD